MLQIERRLGGSQLQGGETASNSPLIDSLFNYHDAVDDFVAQSWIPEPTIPWTGTPALQTVWFAQAASVASQDAADQQRVLNAATPDLSFESTPFNYEQYVGMKAENTVYQPYVRSSNQNTSTYGSDYPSQTPTAAVQPPPYRMNQIPILDGTEYLQRQSYNPDVQHTLPNSAWTPAIEQNIPNCIAPPESTPDPHPIKIGSAGITLDWSTSIQHPDISLARSASPLPAPTQKRKLTCATPPAKKSRSESPDLELSEFVVVFENAPGALANVKRRRKLDAPVRKAARDVRKAGACHQCRFRKRTCSTGTPCNSCLRSGNGLHELKCQRESPFIGKMMVEYFEHSSTRRVVYFDLKAPQNPTFGSHEEIIMVDGVGRLSYPLQLRARRLVINSFKPSDRDIIKKTRDSKAAASPTDRGSLSVIILKDDDLLGTQLEQWAVEYASKFVHAAGPEFYPTTMAIILGTAYVKKGLPESALVAAMLRTASIAFVLRAGVRYTAISSQPPSQFRTVQAMVDTILFARLKQAQIELFKMLQRLVFRSAGYLNRDQVYPVALVFFQILRMLCISSSHLSNIEQRFKPEVCGPADFQVISLKLVLSTHMALFRSSNPLLLDFREKLHQDLLQGDKELIKLAIQMRRVVTGLREKGVPDMKGSLAYRKEYFDMFRKVYTGM